MSNLKLKLIVEQIDFNSEDFKSTLTYLKDYEIDNVALSFAELDNLHIQIIQTKGDWLNFNCIQTDSSYFVEIKLIFHSENLSILEEETIQKVMIKIEDFISNLRNEPGEEVIHLDEIITEDGLIIKGYEGGGWGVGEDLIDFLEKEGIGYRLLNHQQSRFDGGASGGFEAVLIYIAASAASGITWDILKELLTSKFKYSEVFANRIEERKYKQLRKNVADRINEEPQDLVLTEFYKNEQDIIIEFKVRNIIENTVTIICDNEYQIKELKREIK